jgi:hypothetical protein
MGFQVPTAFICRHPWQIRRCSVPDYLVEVYCANLRADELSGVGGRVRSAAEELTRQGAPVRFIGSISVPGDEMCFLIYEAPSASIAGEVSERALVPFERVVEAVRIGWWDEPDIGQ